MWGEPIEVAERVFRIDAPLGERVVSLYLVSGDDEALLFDTGMNGTIPEYVLPSLDRVGITRESLRTVVISHCDVDHFGGMSDAIEHFAEARVVAHPQDAAEIQDFDVYLAHRGRGFVDSYGLDEAEAAIQWSRSVTRESQLHDLVNEGDVVQLGGRDVTILHVPGHSRGHLALSVPDVGALLISDAILGSAVPLANGSPAFPPTYRYLDDYLATIERAQSMRPEVLLTAHYRTYRTGEVSEFLEASTQFALEFGRSVEAAIAAAGRGGSSLRELARVLNSTVRAWPAEGTDGALAFPIAAHLEKLISEGRVGAVDEESEEPAWVLM